MVTSNSIPRLAYRVGPKDMGPEALRPEHLAGGNWDGESWTVEGLDKLEWLRSWVPKCLRFIRFYGRIQDLDFSERLTTYFPAQEQWQIERRFILKQNPEIEGAEWWEVLGTVAWLVLRNEGNYVIVEGDIWVNEILDGSGFTKDLVGRED